MERIVGRLYRAMVAFATNVEAAAVLPAKPRALVLRRLRSIQLGRYGALGDRVYFAKGFAVETPRASLLGEDGYCRQSPQERFIMAQRADYQLPKFSVYKSTPSNQWIKTEGRSRAMVDEVWSIARGK